MKFITPLTFPCFAAKRRITQSSPTAKHKEFHLPRPARAPCSRSSTFPSRAPAGLHTRSSSSTCLRCAKPYAFHRRSVSPGISSNGGPPVDRASEQLKQLSPVCPNLRFSSHKRECRQAPLASGQVTLCRDRAVLRMSYFVLRT